MKNVRNREKTRKFTHGVLDERLQLGVLARNGDLRRADEGLARLLADRLAGSVRGLVLEQNFNEFRESQSGKLLHRVKMN